MKHVFVLFTLLIHLLATMFSPALCADVVSAQSQFRVFIDERRALRVEGTDESDTIIATVIGDPTSSPKPDAPTTIKTGRANIEIEYSRTNLVSRPQKLSFSLDAFDRIVLNAGRGDDFVNIIDALELLDSSKKLLNLNGGDGDNVVVLSHVPFKRETVAPFKRLTQLSLELEAIAKRGTDATSAALSNDAMKAIDAARSNLADVSKSIASDTEKQVMNTARQLVDHTGPQATKLGNSFVTRSDELAKLQGDFANDLTKAYDPTNGVYPPDDKRSDRRRRYRTDMRRRNAGYRRTRQCLRRFPPRYLFGG